MLVERLPVFVQSADLEVQERVSDSCQSNNKKNKIHPQNIDQRKQGANLQWVNGKQWLVGTQMANLNWQIVTNSGKKCNFHYLHLIILKYDCIITILRFLSFLVTDECYSLSVSNNYLRLFVTICTTIQLAILFSLIPICSQGVKMRGCWWICCLT